MAHVDVIHADSKTGGLVI